MSIHDTDTTRLERITPRAVQPVLSQEERLARRSFVAICLVAFTVFLVSIELWRILLAFMVVHVMVR